MSEMIATTGPALEAELAYRREQALRLARAGKLGVHAGSTPRRLRRRRGLRLPVAGARPAALA